MRNTFGPLIVLNSNLKQLEISSPDYSTFTSAVETPVELLGAHEFYYWGWGQQLMAKIADGASFKMFRLANDYAAVLAAGSGVTNQLNIQQSFKRLWRVPYKTIVPPVFVQDVAVVMEV